MLFELIAAFTPIPEGIVIFLQISQHWLVVLVHLAEYCIETLFKINRISEHRP